MATAMCAIEKSFHTSIRFSGSAYSSFYKKTPCQIMIRQTKSKESKQQEKLVFTLILVEPQLLTV